ncbi:MAG: KH domain-containing protein [Acidimicrobiales bacterium]
MSDTAEDVLHYLVSQIVENPDEVDIEVHTEGDRVVLTARVASGDMGRVIGKRGRVARSIRTLVRAAAAKDGLTAEVEFDG